MATLTVRKDNIIYIDRWNDVNVKTTMLSRYQFSTLNVKDMARYINYRLVQFGKNKWFRVTKNGVYDLTTAVPACDYPADFYNANQDQDLYNMVTECVDYFRTDLKNVFFKNERLKSC